MTKLITIFICLLPFFSEAQTVYHVASDGSGDFTTLSQVNAQTFSPGDQILFKKGDTFYGTITVSNSGSAGNPITYGAYGSGNNPIITGFTNVTSWTNKGSNLWESTDAISGLSYTNMVSINGVNTAMGRYPNPADGTGYLTYTNLTSTSLTCSALSGTPNWTGADMKIKKNGYSIERANITAQSGSNLTFTCPNLETGQDGFGFFIQNDIRTLDTQNEWYYNPSTNKIDVYSTSTPTNFQIATVENLMVANSGVSYITVDGIDFTGANSTALNFNYNDFNNLNYITVKNCNISYCGIDGLKIGGTNAIVDGNTFSRINNSGMDLAYSCIGALVQNNTIKNTGLLDGMVQTYAIGTLFVEAPNALIQYNNIDSSGYAGIRFLGSNTVVQYNFVNHSLINRDDGGGIYTWGIPGNTYTGRQIKNNIVLNTIGSSNGTISNDVNDPSKEVIAIGIYLDAYSDDVLVQGNTVSGCHGAGYLISNNNNIRVLNNTAYNNSLSTTFTQGEILLQYFCCLAERNITLKHNIFVAKQATKPALFAYTNYNDVTQFFTISDSNYFARPINDNTVFSVQDATQRTLDLTGWRSFTGQDVHSSGSSKTITDTSDFKFIYNATNSAQDYSLDYKYIDVKGTTFNSGNITLQPYASAVLIKNGALDGVAAPTISLSGNQTITVDSTTIYATPVWASGHSGTVAWTKTSGPGTTTITPSGYNATVSNLQTGTYVFRCTATQDDSQSAYAEVTVTVNIAENLPPNAYIKLRKPTNLINKQ